MDDAVNVKRRLRTATLAATACAHQTSAAQAYHRELAPSHDLWALLESCADSALRVYIPDTVVFTPGRQPMWFYTDAEGVVRSTTKFAETHVLSKLGHRRFVHDVTAVKKVSSLEPAHNGHEDAVRNKGAALTVLSTHGESAGRCGAAAAPSLRRVAPPLRCRRTPPHPTRDPSAPPRSPLRPTRPPPQPSAPSTTSSSPRWWPLTGRRTGKRSSGRWRT